MTAAPVACASLLVAIVLIPAVIRLFRSIIGTVRLWICLFVVTYIRWVLGDLSESTFWASTSSATFVLWFESILFATFWCCSISTFSRERSSTFFHKLGHWNRKGGSVNRTIRHVIKNLQHGQEYKPCSFYGSLESKSLESFWRLID